MKKKNREEQKDCGPLKASQSDVLEEETKVLGESKEGGGINLVDLPSIAGDWDGREEDHHR
jgi:hypothetical protein